MTRVSRTLPLLLALTAIAVPRAASAQATLPVPSIVADGFATYLRSDFRSALAVWLKDSPAENAATVEQMVSVITPVETAYGHVRGYDVLRVVQLGTAVRRVYVVIRYDRGPLYAWFECYESGGKWIIPSFLTNSRASEILPANAL